MGLMRYLAIRGIGLGMFALSLLGMTILLVVLATSGPSLVWALGLGLGVFCAYAASPLAFSRRARVGTQSFVPPILPFPDRFRIRTRLLSLQEISEVYNRMAGARLVGLTFETRDGKKFVVLRGIVGKELFGRFLDIKHRFYERSAR